MKKLFVSLLFVFIAATLFAQQKDTVKHVVDTTHKKVVKDTTQSPKVILVVQESDTTKICIYYKEGGFVKYQDGYNIRKGYYSQAFTENNGWRNYTDTFYDLNYKKFNKQIFTIVVYPPPVEPVKEQKEKK